MVPCTELLTLGYLGLLEATVLTYYYMVVSMDGHVALNLGDPFHDCIFTNIVFRCRSGRAGMFQN